MEPSNNNTISAHNHATTEVIAQSDNVPKSDEDLKPQIVTSQPDDVQTITVIPTRDPALTCTMNEGDHAAGIMAEVPSPVEKVEQPIEDANGPMLDVMSHMATPSVELADDTHTNPHGIAGDAVDGASREDANRAMGAADDENDLFGDDTMEGYSTTVGLVDSRTIINDPNENVDDGRAYERDPGVWNDTGSGDEDLAEQSLANIIAQQRRLDRGPPIVKRGALDPGSEDDSFSSEEDDDDDDDAMDVDSEMEMDMKRKMEAAMNQQHNPGGYEENDMDDDDVDDAELLDTGGSQPSGDHDPSQPWTDFEVIAGSNESYHIFPRSTLRHLSDDSSEDEDDDQRSLEDDKDDDSFGVVEEQRPHTTLPSELVDDVDDMENVMNELAKDPAPRVATPTPPPQSLRRHKDKGKERSLAEMRSDDPQDNSDTLAVAPTQTLQAHLGFVPTRLKAGRNRGARGVPRRPDMDEASSLTPLAPVPSTHPIATLPMPSGGLPMPSISLPMPSMSLQMPSGSLSVPPTRRSIESANTGREQALPVSQPASIEDAQAAMLAAMTAAKRSGASFFGTPRVAPVAPDLASASEDVDMEDHSWMEELGENPAADDIEYLELAIQVRSLERRFASGGHLPEEQFQLLRMREDLRKLEKREPQRQRPPSEPENIEDGESSGDDGEDGEDDDRNQGADPEAEELNRIKRRKLADEKNEEALGIAIQREMEQPTNLPTSSHVRRLRTAREVHERDGEKHAEKQHAREERAFFNEGKTSKSKKTNTESPLQDPQARRKLFKNRLATQSDDSRDDIIAKVLEFINPSADAVAQRLEQGEVPAEPEIRASTKQQQIADLLATIPADMGSRETRAAKSQMAELKRAAQNFGFGKVKARNGRWLLSGMETGLYHHQLDGANWMVSRELATKDPKGGILADAMGLGKTVTTLACIVGNPPDSKSIKKRQKATLVVVPASLLKQWESEVEKHVKPEVLSKVQIYKKSSKLKLRVIEDCNIIITTYAEVLSSWNIKMTESDTKTADEIGIEVISSSPNSQPR